MRRAAIGVAMLGVLIGGTAAAGLAVRRSVDASESSCAARLADAERKVRTDRWDPPKELADLGDYLGIHWQVRAGGAACSRAPGPVEWQYQAVVQLRPAQAQALAQRISAAAKQAAVDHPATDQPTTDQPTTEQPTTDQPTTEQPTTGQPTSGQPTVGQSSAGQLAAGGSTGQLGGGMAAPGDVWPGLAEFLPTGATWVHQEAYDELHHSTRWRALYVDPVSSRAFVVVNDH